MFHPGGLFRAFSRIFCRIADVSGSAGRQADVCFAGYFTQVRIDISAAGTLEGGGCKVHASDTEGRDWPSTEDRKVNP